MTGVVLRFNRLTRSCCIILLASSSALAAEPTTCPDPDHPDRCFATGLVEGEQAPFDGDLLTPELSIHWAQTADNAQQKIDLAVTATTAAWRVHRDHERRLRVIDNRAGERRLKTQKEHYARLLSEARPDWYETPIPVALAATALVLGVLVLAIEVLELEIGQRQ